MSIEQFPIQPPADPAVITVLAALIIAGVVLVVLSFSDRIIKAIPSFSLSSRHFDNKYGFIICGITLIALPLAAFFTAFNTSSTVTIGTGYVDVQFAGFSPNSSIPFLSGNMNVTSNQIDSAFVGQVGSGEFTLDKQQGANAGDTNIGLYKLGNGAKAYIASINSTDLIIKLNSGEYLIVGTSNTDALAASFAQNVHPLTSP